MDVLTEKQIKEIAKIIENYTGVVMYSMTGSGKPDSETLKKLGIPENALSLIENAYILGKLVQILNETDIKKITYEELKKRASKMTLTVMEKNSLKYAQQNAGQYVTALGQKMSRQINTQVVNASKSANLEIMQRNLIRDTVSQSIVKQQTRGKLASELYHNLEDWTRDWRRVAHTELWNSRLQGEVASILAGDTIHGEAKGGDTLIFRRPSPDACNHCKRLYLESDGVTPKIFKMSELLANGDNVGRKVSEWLPTTHTTHPNCTCPIAVLPDGFGFDIYGNLEFKG